MCVPGLPRLCVGCWACLRKAVTLLDRDLQAIIYCVYELLCQWRGARIHHSHCAEVVLSNQRVLSKQDDDRRNNVKECDLELLNELAEIF